MGRKTLSSRRKRPTQLYLLTLLIVRKITEQKVFNINVEVRDLIMLADYRFNFPDKIDKLLGTEIFYELLRPVQIYSQSSKLLLQNTVFGYVAR